MTDLYKTMVPCPKCKGNGYVRAEKSVFIDCDECDSQGEVPRSRGKEAVEGYTAISKGGV
jgi:DnaJ-class molecular chaperone